MVDSPFRNLPAVDELVREMQSLRDGIAHGLAVEAARHTLAEARTGIADGNAAPDGDVLVRRALEAAEIALRPSLRPVINASGVLLQTNLGRAPLSDRAIAAMDAVARGYSNLEFDLDRGERGSRHEHVRALIRRVTGADDGLVVNNNAAGLFFALQAFAQGREVIVSRGQAVEIGGGFRIPDVLRQSGARLVEVGTTNRTYLRDYAEAITPETTAILRVHASNFRVVGFTAEPALAELAELAHSRAVLLLDDLGSGCLVDMTRYGLPREPTVQETIAGGADLALFSGDKLLGGPQCGIISGRAELVAELRRHPLARALRVDKLTIAALNATLFAYVAGSAEAEIPILRMLSEDLRAIKRRALTWARAAGEPGSVVASRTMVGGGSLPGEGVPTWCTAIGRTDATKLAARLRASEPPIVGRIHEGRLLLDPRTVAKRNDAVVAKALSAAIQG